MGKDKKKDVGAAQVRNPIGSKRAPWLSTLSRRASTGRVDDARNRRPFLLLRPGVAHRLTAHPLRRRTQVTEDFAIQPEKITPTLDASKWPLLLKNYDKLMVREADHPSPPTQFSHTSETRVCWTTALVSSFPRFRLFVARARRAFPSQSHVRADH